MTSTSTLTALLEEDKLQVPQVSLKSFDATQTTSVAEGDNKSNGGTAFEIQELTLACGDGMTLAAQLWVKKENNPVCVISNDEPFVSKPPPRRAMLLHGWLDNCRTFYYMAPELLKSLPVESEILALDLPGHGHSSHKSQDAPPTGLSEAIYYVAEAVRILGWIGKPMKDGHNETHVEHDTSTILDSTLCNYPPFILIGHSMGAAIATLYAAAFSEQLSHLVLLDGGLMGPPLTDASQRIANMIRNHVVNRQIQQDKKSRKPRLYGSIEDAVYARCQAPKRFPGQQWISEHAAREIVQRGSQFTMRQELTMVNGRSDDDYKNNNNNKTNNLYWSSTLANNNPNANCGSSSLYFCHDPRLLWPMLMSLTTEQAEAIYENIHCPTMVLLAEHGIPHSDVNAEQALHRLHQRLKQGLVITLPGSHHFHADPETAPAVVKAVVDFLL